MNYTQGNLDVLLVAQALARLVRHSVESGARLDPISFSYLPESVWIELLDILTCDEVLAMNGAILGR